MTSVFVAHLLWELRGRRLVYQRGYISLLDQGAPVSQLGQYYAPQEWVEAEVD
jgi:hypothetical protein